MSFGSREIGSLAQFRGPSDEKRGPTVSRDWWFSWSSYQTGFCVPGFYETLENGSPAPIQYEHDNNQLGFRSLSLPADASPAVQPYLSGIFIPPVYTKSSYYLVSLGRSAGARLLSLPAAFVATIHVYPTADFASCCVGFRAFRGTDADTWSGFERLHDSVSNADLSDVVEMVVLMFHGGDPDGTYRAYTKGGFETQVAQRSGALAGSGSPGFYSGNPPVTASSSSSSIYWLPEGPRRGPTGYANPRDQQVYNWTGGILLDASGPRVLLGGHTDCGTRLMERPFPDRARCATLSLTDFEWFLGAVTGSEFDDSEPFGDPAYGPFVLRQLTVATGEAVSTLFRNPDRNPTLL